MMRNVSALDETFWCLLIGYAAAFSMGIALAPAAAWWVAAIGVSIMIVALWRAAGVLSWWFEQRAVAKQRGRADA